ncbi:hypothetical protein D9M69_634740 [compost metagenome]
MLEAGPQLGVGWVVLVVEPFDRNAPILERSFIEVVSCCRAGNVDFCLGLYAEIGQPFTFAVQEIVVPGVVDRRVDCELATNCLNECAVEF